MDTRSGTFARYRLLKKALEGGKDMSPSLVNACKSQGGLARLKLISEGIFPMALNTLKACANELIEDGGWKKLDEMRRSFRSIHQTGHGTSKQEDRSKINIAKMREKELTESLEIERRYRIRLEVAYDELLMRLRSKAKFDSDLANYLNRHISGFSFKRLSVAGGKVEQ